MGRISSFLCRGAGLALALITAVNAQSPTQVYTFAPSCTAGLTPYNPPDANGTFTDSFGASWQVNCNQRNQKAFTNQGGTRNRGISACFRGCDKRPSCTGFYFIGTQNVTNDGSGQCYYQLQTLSYYLPDSAVYAGASMINSSPQLPCPYYNNTQMIDYAGNTWGIMCGFDGGPGPFSSPQVDNMNECYARCNSNVNCTQYSFSYSGGEPEAITGGTGGTCSLKTGTPNVNGLTRNQMVNWAYRVNSVALTSSIASSSSSTSTSTSTSTSSSSFSSSSSSSTSTTSTSSPSTNSASSSTSSSANTSSVNSESSSSTTTSTSTTSSPGMSINTAAFTGVCTTTGPVSPTAPACPGSNGLQYTSPCGSVYTVYCNTDSDPGSVDSKGASSLAACMSRCDEFSGCKAATFNGGTCFLKTGFNRFTNAGSTVHVLVRFIPPNANYAIPPPAGSTNASTGCGSPLWSGLTPNGNSQTYSFTGPDGLTRSYHLHIPQFYDPNRASPLIFGYHGNLAQASTIEGQTGFNDGVLNPYGIAVYVQGMGGGFISNPDWGPTGNEYPQLDDVGFMKQFIPYLTSSFCVDTGRIWVTGQSNGGGFVNVMACDPYLSTVISVFTGSSSAMYTGFTSGDPATIEPVNTPTQPLCSPGRNNIAYMEVHGSLDDNIGYYGGFKRRRVLPAIPHWSQAWAVRQGYSATNFTTNVTPNISVYQFGNANNLGILTQVTLWAGTRCVHCWATLKDNQFSSSQAFMDFFYDQTRTWGTGPAPAISSSISSSSTHSMMSPAATGSN